MRPRPRTRPPSRPRRGGSPRRVVAATSVAAAARSCDSRSSARSWLATIPASRAPTSTTSTAGAGDARPLRVEGEHGGRRERRRGEQREAQRRQLRHRLGRRLAGLPHRRVQRGGAEEQVREDPAGVDRAAGAVVAVDRRAASRAGRRPAGRRARATIRTYETVRTAVPNSSRAATASSSTSPSG